MMYGRKSRARIVFITRCHMLYRVLGLEDFEESRHGAVMSRHRKLYAIKLEMVECRLILRMEALKNCGLKHSKVINVLISFTGRLNSTYLRSWCVDFINQLSVFRGRKLPGQVDSGSFLLKTS
jgi:hypothetical protein